MKTKALKFSEPLTFSESIQQILGSKDKEQ